MLASRPDLVRMERARREVGEAFLEYYQTYCAEGGRLRGLVSYGLPDTRSVSATGVMGDPTFVNSEKGAQIFEGAVVTLAAIIDGALARGDARAIVHEVQRADTV